MKPTYFIISSIMGIFALMLLSFTCSHHTAKNASKSSACSFLLSKTKQGDLALIPIGNCINNNAYVLQMKQIPAGFKNAIFENVQAQYDNNTVRLFNSSGNLCSFTIEQKTGTSENVYGGYGLAELRGAKLNSDLDLASIANIEVSLPGVCSCNPNGTASTCSSGGEGATKCGISGGIASAGWGCSVSCDSGYYACGNNFLQQPVIFLY